MHNGIKSLCFEMHNGIRSLCFEMHNGSIQVPVNQYHSILGIDYPIIRFKRISLNQYQSILGIWLI